MTTNPTVKRPILRYHGGKWRLAPWVISHFPEHRVYVEPFGGAASVLLRKPRAYSEVWNDLDGEIHNLFTVARQSGGWLINAIRLTPYSREEYRQSFLLTKDPMEQARRTLIRSYMGFGSNSLCRAVKSGFRSCSNSSGTTPSNDWSHFPDSLPAILDRFRGVVLENRDALQVMYNHDSPATLHYCDPPYVHSTRTAWGGHGARSGYLHEMSDADHIALSKFLSTLQGKVILSGYSSPLYDHLYSDWRHVKKAALADQARKRTEVLWMNY